jgi:tetratricopeptide (TPR) repeat protein
MLGVIRELPIALQQLKALLDSRASLHPGNQAVLQKTPQRGRTVMNCAWGSRGPAYLASLTLWSIAGALATSQTAKSVDMDELFAAMERLQVAIPMSVAGRDPVRRHLEELNREPCDQRAIADLGKALDDAGYRREAANAHVRFSQTCGGQPASLRAAVNILLKLSDYTHVVSVATDLIKLEPYNDNGFFLRAVAYQRAGSYQRAIDDYVTAIELFGNKDRISSASYLGIARSMKNWIDSVMRWCPSNHGYL